MKESYSEVLARHAGPESYADRGNTLGVATAGVHAGPVLSSVNRFIPCADVVQTAEGNIASSANGKHEVSVAEWDALILGGGPAGCATAIAARQAGLRVLLLEVSARGRRNRTALHAPGWRTAGL